jgi:hypothetical protein
LSELPGGAMKLKCLALVFLLSLASSWFPGAAKSRPDDSQNQVVWAHSFVRAFYPALEGKKYFLSAETSFLFDRTDSSLSWLEIDVGEGPKNSVLGSIGGCVGNVVAPPLPLPKEFTSPPSAPPAGPEQQPRESEKGCESGPIKPKQILITGFKFGATGQFISFVAQGQGVGDPQSEIRYQKSVSERMSDAEITAALKRAGAKYGPGDSVKIWSREWELNPRPADYESAALPLSYLGFD